MTENDHNYQFNLGETYDNKKEYKMAIKYYQLSADQGNANAQNNLGYMYHNGFGVNKDYKMTVKYYQLSAQQCDVDSAKKLGNIYEEQKNYLEAIYWYQKAIDYGCKDSQ